MNANNGHWKLFATVTDALEIQVVQQIDLLILSNQLVTYY